MGQNFIACDREQAFLMPPDVREWLPDGHLAWFVIDAVGEMDLSAFYNAYRADGHGRAAYEPAMMVALILYAYARGIRSSRVIERACEEDVAYRVIAAQQRPDHATIARFVERHQDALAELFGAACARGLAWSDPTSSQAGDSESSAYDSGIAPKRSASLIATARNSYRREAKEQRRARPAECPLSTFTGRWVASCGRTESRPIRTVAVVVARRGGR